MIRFKTLRPSGRVGGYSSAFLLLTLGTVACAGAPVGHARSCHPGGGDEDRGIVFLEVVERIRKAVDGAEPATAEFEGDDAAVSCYRTAYKDGFVRGILGANYSVRPSGTTPHVRGWTDGHRAGIEAWAALAEHFQVDWKSISR